MISSVILICIVMCSSLAQKKSKRALHYLYSREFSDLRMLQAHWIRFSVRTRMKRYCAILLMLVSIAAPASAEPDFEEFVLAAPGGRYALRYMPIDNGKSFANLRIVAVESDTILWSYEGDGETSPTFNWSPNGNRLAIGSRSVRWVSLTIVEFRDGAFVKVEVEIPDFPLTKDVPQKFRKVIDTVKCEAWTDNNTARLSFLGRCQLLDKEGMRLPEWVNYKYSGKLEFDLAQNGPKFTLLPESSIRSFVDKVEQDGGDQPTTRPESK